MNARLTATCSIGKDETPKVAATVNVLNWARLIGTTERGFNGSWLPVVAISFWYSGVVNNRFAGLQLAIV